MKKKIVIKKIVKRLILAITLIVLGCLIFLILAFKTCFVQNSIYGLKRMFTKEQVIFIGEDTSWSGELKPLVERAVWKYPPTIPDDTTLTMKKMLLILDRYGYDMIKLKKDTSKRRYMILFDVYKKEMDNCSLKGLFYETGHVRDRPFQFHKNCGYDDFYEIDDIASIEVLLSPLDRKPDYISLRVAYFEDGIYETYALEKIQLPIEEHKDESELSKFYYQLQQSKKNKEIEPSDADMPEVIFWTWEDGEKHINHERPIQLNKGGAY